MKKLSLIAIIITATSLFPFATFAQGGLDQRIAELSQQISKEMTLYQKTTIAVVEFADLRGNVTDFGRFLAEELITRLHQTRKFKVIERQLLNKVLSEQALSLTGVIDPNSAKQLGRVLGVDAIASGTITDLAQSLKVNSRLISAETGEIFSVASTEIFKDESVMRLLEGGITNTNAPEAAKRATPASTNGKGILPGMEFRFQDKTVEVEKQFRLTLVSVEIIEKNIPKLNLTIENLNDRTLSFSLRNAKTQSYITDQNGDSFMFKDATILSDNSWKELPPGILTRFSLLFTPIPETTNQINAVIRINKSGSYMENTFPIYYDCTFRNLDLR